MHLTSNLRDKELFVFDLDGTIAPSKSTMDREMSELLARLLLIKKVAIISGGKFDQFKRQFLANLRVPRALLGNLFLFPTTSTSFYHYRHGWRQVYAHKLSKGERKKIVAAMHRVFHELHYRNPKRLYGPVIEDRGTQITFSAVGQNAPVKVKEAWNRRYDIRPRLIRALRKYLPQFEVRRGGLTSIDVTRKGIDKAYGIRKIVAELEIPLRRTLFVGDALYPGGNDYPARRTGVLCVPVSGPTEAKGLIRFITYQSIKGRV